LHFDAGHVRQNRASDNAKHYLQSLVFSGQLAPGDKLPPEKQLAEQLGIAVSTLRPALKSLEYDGLITVKLGSKSSARARRECMRSSTGTTRSSTTTSLWAHFVTIADMAPDGSVRPVSNGNLKAYYREVDESKSSEQWPWHPFDGQCCCGPFSL
jgi:DNA-binding transcriptional regulator YhcF (GntR family)